MKKVAMFLYDIFHYLFIITFMLILLIVFSNINGVNNKVIMILMTCLIITILFALYFIIQRYGKRIENMNIKYIFLLFAIFIIIQLIIGITLKVTPSWDFGFVYDEAVYLTENDTWIVSNQSYFQMYPNNQFYLLTLTVIFKIMRMFHFTNYVLGGILINVIFVDISLIILFICMRKIWNNKIALFGLLISFLCTAYVLYLPIFYTDTFPLPFANCMLLLYIFIVKEKDKKKNVLYLFLLTFSTMIGFEYKATVIILLIAIILHMIFILKLKQAVLSAAAILLVFIGSTKIYKASIESLNIFDVTLNDRYNFPYTHWIMMGLKGSGGYSGDDYRYTKSFESKEEKTEANILTIKQRLNDMGFIGFAEHLYKKVNYTWEDGTYFSTKLLSRKPDTNGIMRNIFSEEGKYVKKYKDFANGMHYAILILMILSAVHGLKIAKQKNQMDFISCLRLSVYGLFLFLLIWESKSKYLVNYLPIFYLVAIDGMNYLWYLIKRRGVCKNEISNCCSLL